MSCAFKECVVLYKIYNLESAFKYFFIAIQVKIVIYSRYGNYQMRSGLVKVPKNQMGTQENLDLFLVRHEN
jgi:hypothetical protein